MNVVIKMQYLRVNVRRVTNPKVVRHFTHALFQLSLCLCKIPSAQNQHEGQ